MAVPRDLGKEMPHLSAFFPYIDLLNKESDRGKVLISCGFMEEQLKNILLAFLANGKAATELLNAASAPLGTFSSRIAACYALGLIDQDEHHDLTLLRKVRNDFAHGVHTSFDTPSVADRCKLLTLKAHDYSSEEMGVVAMPASGQFTTAAVSLIMRFTNRPHYVAKQRRTVGSWPYG